MGRKRQKVTGGATGASARQQWPIRRGLLGVGVLTAVGALAACSGAVANTAGNAVANTAGNATAADSQPATASISRAIAHGKTAQSAVKSGAKPAKRPKATSSTATPSPTATETTTGAPTATASAIPTATPSAASTATPTGSQGGDPSGESPATTLSGFTLKYTQEFTGDTIPANWSAYLGVPGGESSSTAEWEPGMCTFSGGEAHFMASGIDSCGMHYLGSPQEYGAWFARLQATAEPSGQLFSDVFLLWPSNNQWPPEIDVYEDEGDRARTVATLWNTVGGACGSAPTSACLGEYQQGNGEADGVANTDTEWHTYGVEWTPSGVSWLIDGHVILTAPASAVKSPAAQPALPMNMALQSQNLPGTTGSPTSRDTMNVDWVEQFTYNG